MKKCPTCNRQLHPNYRGRYCTERCENVANDEYKQFSVSMEDDTSYNSVEIDGVLVTYDDLPF